MGKNNSILTRVKQQNPSVYFNGCQCHVVHNTSAAAAKAFNAVIGFDVEDLLVDIYHGFSILPNENASWQNTPSSAIKNTRRWLSLEKVVTRTLLQYQSLKTYFLSENDSTTRFKRFHTAFSNPMTEVYLLFYQSTLQVFINLKLFLQREEPLIGAINSSLKRFVKLLACKFISPVPVRASTSFQQLLDVEQSLPGICVFLKSTLKKKTFITKKCCTAQGMCVINIL